MSQYSFGAGVLFGVPKVANPTPVRFGALQGVDVSFNFTTKMLHGSYQFPLAVGRGTASIPCKASYGQFNANAIAAFFGVPSDVTTGQLLVAVDEAGTVPGSPFQITVANSATWTTDLGVRYAATGLFFTRVAAAPAAGQYSVAAGVYTFNTADQGPVLISYEYTSPSGGKRIAITNQLLGSSQFFRAELTEVFDSKRITLVLNKCISSQLALSWKLEDFTIPDFDFQAMADDNGTSIGEISIVEL